MKTAFVVLALSLIGFSNVYAKSVSASAAERKLLCSAIELATEQQATDFAADIQACLESKEVTSELISEGTRIVIAPVKFNYIGYSSDLLCYLAYQGQPEISNIIGGVDAGIVCK